MREGGGGGRRKEGREREEEAGEEREGRREREGRGRVGIKRQRYISFKQSDWSVYFTNAAANCHMRQIES